MIHPDQTSDVPALLCTGLVKRFPDVLAVAGVDLVVRRGECFGLLGPNGAGKTTTVEILEGLTRPDEGRVVVLGQAWGEKDDRRLRARLGVALQETHFSDRLTVEEVVGLFRSFHDGQGRSVDEVLTVLGLLEKRRARVGKLSGGQRQRMALACALVGDPELLFLDEPTTGLDPQARLRIWEVVERFRAGGGTVLLTTHYMDEASRLCDRVAIMDRGRIIALDTPAALVASLHAEQVVEVRTHRPVQPPALAALPGVTGAELRGDVLRLRVDRIGEALPAIAEAAGRLGGGIASMATHEASLEDVFVHLTGRGLRDG